MATFATALTEKLVARYRQVRDTTLRFTAPLNVEDMMVQSCDEASPTKWHLAHTTWFFETFILSEFAAGYKPFHPDFRWLFNSYYNAVGDQPEKKLRASFSRPPLADILAYRAHVDAAIAALLTSEQCSDEVLRRVVLGLEHEQQHLELAHYDIKHALYTNPLHPAYLPPLTTSNTPAVAATLQWLDYNPGLTQVGLTLDAADPEAFAWDNETPQHPVFVAPFRLASRLVTVSEYLAFINDNAYTRPELWLSEGWDAVREYGWQAPLYWQRNANSASGWQIYTMRGVHSLEDLVATPVCHISFFEADAYARWAGHRLPTEQEWECAASTLGQPQGNLLESAALHPVVTTGGNDLQQMYGDVWEWTASPYTGYPGYKPLPGALGEYNGKFMSSQMVLRGGSCVTPLAHIRPTYRNFFHPGTRWHFAGLRLAT